MVNIIMHVNLGEKEVTLRWVEIINGRLDTSAEPLELECLFRDIRNNVLEATGEGIRIMIYRGGVVESDWAIHLHRETDDRPPRRTGLGIKLADLIRPMALVDHSIWIEEDWRGSSKDSTKESSLE